MDIETRRKKQQTMMVQLVERKVRSRAKQLYETRGQEEGQALQDWFQAESEVLENSILAPLYRRLRTGNHDVQESDSARSSSLRIRLPARATRNLLLGSNPDYSRVSRKATLPLQDHGNRQSCSLLPL